VQNEERHNVVIQFISNNQGCTAQQLVDGVNKEISRVTVYKTLKGLLKEGIVRDRATNRRDHKFFVDVNNPLFSIPQQLQEIEQAFRNLLNKSEKYLQRMDKQKLTPDLLFEYATGYYITMYLWPAFILRIITDSLLQHSTTIWITKYRDKNTLNQLFTIVFMKLLSLNSDYAKYLKNIRRGDIERAQVKEAAFTRNLSPLQLMYASRKVYKQINMENQIDEMLDLLWKFDKDIRKFLFPEIEFYKWDSKYDVHDWRNLLEIFENNPDQTAHNFLTQGVLPLTQKTAITDQ
jgi:predicted transcriptional regulator